MDFSKADWHKTTGVNRQCAIFELVCDSLVLLDVEFSDNNGFEIAFHEGISNIVVDWNNVFRLIEDERKIAESDK